MALHELGDDLARGGLPLGRSTFEMSWNQGASCDLVPGIWPRSFQCNNPLLYAPDVEFLLDDNNQVKYLRTYVFVVEKTSPGDGGPDEGG